MTKIMVTGGTGYIGSHTLVDLIENGYDVISVDNNSRSNAAMLKGVEKITDKPVKNYKVDLYVFHFSGKPRHQRHHSFCGIQGRGRIGGEAFDVLREQPDVAH